MFFGNEMKYLNLQSIGIHVLGGAVILASIVVDAGAQVAGKAQRNSATHAAAEVAKGKLNPSESKPGDEIVLKLKDDMKSNGQVLLKKGSTITGVVKNVKRAEAGSAVH